VAIASVREQFTNPYGWKPARSSPACTVRSDPTQKKEKTMPGPQVLLAQSPLF